MTKIKFYYRYLCCVIGSDRGLMIRLHDLRAVSCEFESEKSQRWWQAEGRASDLNSLLTADVVSQKR